MTAQAASPVTTQQAPNAHWLANIGALRVLQPQLAEPLVALAIGQEVCWVNGRDGCLTAQLNPTAHSCNWLGGSSMPTVSAPAILKDFACNGGNVLLPAIGTGYEAAHLCRVMREHCALFVYLDDLLQLKLALHVCDLARWIALGRLIFLPGPEIEQSLTSFCAAHPGYEVPTRLVTLPHVDGGLLDQLRARLEQCAQRIENDRTEKLRVVHLDWTRDSAKPIREIKRVAVITSEARLETFAIAGKLERTLRAMGHVVRIDLPNSPQSGHVLARVTALHDFRPDLVLVSGYYAPRLVDQVPSTIPIVHWIWPTQILKRSKHAAATPERPVYVADGSLLQQAERDGLVGIGLLEPGAYTDAERRVVSGYDSDPDAVVVCDLPSIDAESLGITQPTHVMLWRTLCTVLTEQTGKVNSPDPVVFLNQCMSRAGVQLKDDAVKSMLISHLENAAIPRWRATEAAGMLKRKAARIAVAGQNWPEEWKEQRLAGSIRQPGDELLGRMACARTAIFPVWDSRSVPLILDILIAGGKPVLFATDRPLAELYPQLHPVLAALPQFRTSTELTRVLSQSSESLKSQQQWERARRMAEEGHMLRHRLTTALSAVTVLA